MKKLEIIQLYEHYLNDNENKPNIFYHGSPHLFDTFSLDHVGSGDTLNKYGFGLYFTDTLELAEFYANELSIGKLKETGMNIYEVKISGLDRFYNWNESMPDYVYSNIIDKLNSDGYESSAEQINDEYEEYGDMWSVDSFYQYLEATLGTNKEVSEFLNICGMNGIITEDRNDRGNIYVCFDDTLIKISNRYKVGQNINENKESLHDHKKEYLDDIERLKKEYTNYKFNHEFRGEGMFKNSWFCQIVKPEGETLSLKGPCSLKDVLKSFLFWTKDKNKFEIDDYINYL